MKYLKIFEVYNPDNLRETLDDIFLDIKDDGFEYNIGGYLEKPKEDIFIPGMRMHVLSITIWKYPTWKYDEIENTISHIGSFLLENEYKLKLISIVGIRLGSIKQLKMMLQQVEVRDRLTIEFSRIIRNQF